MASTVFNVGSLGIGNNSIDWVNNTDIRLLLLSGSGSPAKTAETVTAVLATTDVAEVDADDYERKVLGTKAVTQSSNKTLFDSADVAYAGLGGSGNDDTITGWLIYKGTADPDDDGTNVPIAYIKKEGSGQATNGSPITIQPDATDKWFYLNNPD